MKYIQLQQVHVPCSTSLLLPCYALLLDESPTAQHCSHCCKKQSLDANITLENADQFSKFFLCYIPKETLYINFIRFSNSP